MRYTVRMRLFAFLIWLPLTSAACMSPPPATHSAAAPPSQAAPPVPEAAEQFSGRRVVEQNDLIDFTFAYPSAASAIPGLRVRLEGDLAKLRAESTATAEEDRASRPPDFPFNGHYFHQEWAVAGASDRLLSLSAEVATFTGGAHGNSVFDAILWDRAADHAIEPANLFTDADAAWAAMTPIFCDLLDHQRAEKREESLPLTGEGWMVACPKLAESVVVPVDSDGDGRFDRFDVLLPPYEAGPYAEGSYEVGLVVTDALRSLIKPEYAPSF